MSKYQVPWIIRIINGEAVKFVSARMAEKQFLSSYLQRLKSDIYTCMLVRGFYITESEAELLNEINLKYCGAKFGKELFLTGIDYIVRLEDVYEFYFLIKECYEKLLCAKPNGRRENCGFIRINNESVVPYCIKDNRKYIPLFYFDNEFEHLNQIKLENWELRYLKFCCKVQGIRHEVYASDSCIVASVDEIKNYFPPETNFKEFWPAKEVNSKFINNIPNAQGTPSGAWVKVPSAIESTHGSIQLKALPETVPRVPHNNSVMMNSYQNGWLANQMVCVLNLVY